MKNKIKYDCIPMQAKIYLRKSEAIINLKNLNRQYFWMYVRLYSFWRYIKSSTIEFIVWYILCTESESVQNQRSSKYNVNFILFCP